MAYSPPTYGETGEVYTDNVRNSLEHVRTTAEAAQAAADGNNASVVAASQSADEAKEIAEAAKAFVEAPTDGRVAALVDDPASSTTAVLGAKYGRVGRDSLHLRDYLTTGATTAENRTAFQTAIDDAQAAGKALCVDGAFFDFTGEPVVATANGFTLWGTSTTTNRLTNSTRGKGVITLTGEASTVEGVWLDGANPTVDLAAVAAADRWYSYGAYFAPTAHSSRVRNIRVSGFMRGVLASTFPLADVASGAADADALNETLYPSLTDFVVDGIESENVWAALQPISVDGLSMRRVVGSYVAGQVGGADPHLIYMSVAGSNDGATPVMGRPNKNVVWGDCHSTGGALAPAFKARSTIGLTITGGLTASNTPGLLDLILIEDFTIGEGCASTGDTSGAQASVRFLHCKRGVVAPLLVQHSTAPNPTVPLLTTDRCEHVRLQQPRATINRPTNDTNVWVMGPQGTCPGVIWDRPEVDNLGAAAGVGVIVLDSGVSPGVGSAEIIDPRVSGTFSYGVRVVLPGPTKVAYNPARVAGTLRPLSVDTAVAAADFPVLTNLARGDRPTQTDPSVVGWHYGEKIWTTVTSRWPSGQIEGPVGGTWVGTTLGGLRDSADGRVSVMTADFGKADIDLTSRVRLGSNASAAAGLVARVSGTLTYLGLMLDGTQVALVKREGDGTGNETVLATSAVATVRTIYYALRLVVSGTRMVGYLDGVNVLNYTLTTAEQTLFTANSHGLISRYGADGEFLLPIVR